MFSMQVVMAMAVKWVRRRTLSDVASLGEDDGKGISRGMIVQTAANGQARYMPGTRGIDAAGMTKGVDGRGWQALEGWSQACRRCLSPGLTIFPNQATEPRQDRNGSQMHKCLDHKGGSRCAGTVEDGCR